MFCCRYLTIKKKNDPKNVSTQKYNFEPPLHAQTQDLQIFKKFYVSNEAARIFRQYCILISTTLHSQSLPLKKIERKIYI